MKKLFVAMNWIAVITFLVSASSLDSASWIPSIICALSVAYLGCAVYIGEVIRVNEDV